METSLDKQCTGHPHAENMKLYAEDAMTTNEPWKLWEKCVYGDWYTLVRNPDWDDTRQYRRKPRTININGYEVPEPIRVEPKLRAFYYVVSTESAEPIRQVWDGLTCEHRWFYRGLIHSTKEAAEIHLKALLSFTQQP